MPFKSGLPCNLIIVYLVEYLIKIPVIQQKSTIDSYAGVWTPADIGTELDIIRIP
jgi:hypothetical protein